MAELTMKYKNIVWILVLILLSSFVSAIPDPTHYFNLSTAVYDMVSTVSGSLRDGAIHSSGFDGLGSYYDGNTDWAELSGNTASTLKNESFTLNLWFNTSYTAGVRAIIGSGSGGDYHLSLQSNAQNNFKYFGHNPADAGMNLYTPQFVQGTWYMLTIIKNSTSVTQYWNGVFVNFTTFDLDENNAINVALGSLYGDAAYGANAFSGDIDEVGMWNKSLSASEISDLYNGGAGNFYPFAGPAAVQDIINVSETYPTNNKQFNVDTININATVNSTDNVDCNLYINGSLKDSYTFTGGVEAPIEFNRTFIDGVYTYNMYCEIFGNNTQNETTTNLTFVIDTTSPTFSTDFVNHSIYLSNNLTGSFNFSDNLQLYNVSVSVDGTAIHYQTTTNATYYLMISQSVLDYSVGSHNLTVRYSDGIGSENHILTQSYSFYRLNYSTSYSTGALENEMQYFYLYINKTTGINTSAVFRYNNTAYSFSKTPYANYDKYYVSFLSPSLDSANITKYFNFTFNVTSAYNNITNTIVNGSQIIYRIGIDNCSLFTMYGMNISIVDEDTLLPVNASINAYFEVWINSINDYRTFNLTWDGFNKYGICINPNWAEYLLYSQLEYSATDYETKYYYFTNKTLNNVTELLTLYMTNSTTAVEFTVTDENDNPVEDVYISVLKYDVGTNSYITTEIIKTDSEGVAIGNIVLNTKWYKFILNYDGDIVLETSATKVTSTTVNFQIDLTTNFFDTYDVVDDVACDITFNSATRTFSYTYSDPTGGVISGCLNIIKRSLNGDTVINSSCVDSSSSTILLGVGNVTTGLYIGTGTINIDGTNYVCGDAESKDYSTLHQTFGLGGIFVSFLLVLTLVMIGVWHPVVAVFLMIVGVVATNIIGIFHLTWEILISFVIIGFITIYRLNSK